MMMMMMMVMVFALSVSRGRSFPTRSSASSSRLQGRRNPGPACPLLSLTRQSRMGTRACSSPPSVALPAHPLGSRHQRALPCPEAVQEALALAVVAAAVVVVVPDRWSRALLLLLRSPAQTRARFAPRSC